MANKRLFMSIPEDELIKLDLLKDELGMDRSHYIRYLLSGEKKRIPETIRQKKLIEQLSSIDLHLRHICLKEGMEPGDVLYVFEALKDIRKALDTTFGPMDQKSKGGEKREKV